VEFVSWYDLKHENMANNADGPMVISMFSISSMFTILFGYVEWRVSSLPMVPCKLPLHCFCEKLQLIKHNITIQKHGITAIMIQNFFFSAVYYSYLYYLPIYYQNVRQYSTLKSALWIIPMVLTQAVASILSGQYISRTKRYGEVIVIGFMLFCIGVSLTALFSKDFPVRYVIGILIVLGYGNGNVFQPTIVALQAHARKSQRAVVISVRNFLRCLGGAIGLAVSAVVLQNVLKASLPSQFKYLAA